MYRSIGKRRCDFYFTLTGVIKKALDDKLNEIHHETGIDYYKLIKWKKKIKDRFANPRNAASGSLRQKDPNVTKKIPFFKASQFKFFNYTNAKAISENVQNLNFPNRT